MLYRKSRFSFDVRCLSAITSIRCGAVSLPRLVASSLSNDVSGDAEYGRCAAGDEWINALNDRHVAAVHVPLDAAGGYDPAASSRPDRSAHCLSVTLDATGECRKTGETVIVNEWEVGRVFCCRRLQCVDCSNSLRCIGGAPSICFHAVCRTQNLSFTSFPWHICCSVRLVIVFE